MLGIATKESLVGHPIVGASWEGFVIENLLSLAPVTTEASFYRSSGGAEVDLVLSWPDSTIWLIEIKRSLSPKVERGFHAAWDHLAADRGIVVYSGDDRYRISERVEVMSLPELIEELLARPAP